MISGKEFSRREFLRTFALLSSSTLLVGLNSGCGTSSGVPRALYGPAPPNVTHPEVSSFYYMDAQSNHVTLDSNQNVPVQVACLIEFTKDMNTSKQVTISFSDAALNPVPFSKSWQDARTLSVTPSSSLSPGTSYTLGIGDDAEDTYGNTLYPPGGASITFKTAP